MFILDEYDCCCFIVCRGVRATICTLTRILWRNWRAKRHVYQWKVHTLLRHSTLRASCIEEALVDATNDGNEVKERKVQATPSLYAILPLHITIKDSFRKTEGWGKRNQEERKIKGLFWLCHLRPSPHWQAYPLSHPLNIQDPLQHPYPCHATSLVNPADVAAGLPSNSSSDPEPSTATALPEQDKVAKHEQVSGIKHKSKWIMHMVQCAVCSKSCITIAHA